MTRFGIAVAALIVLGLIALASMVRVTGPVAPVATAPKPAAKTGEAAPAVPVKVGRLVLPVEGVQAAQLADSWADPRGDGTRTHHVIDIMAPRGTPVLAAADGRIEKLFLSKLGGNTLYERSTDGTLVYYYAHLAGYAPGIAEGIQVRAGQPIAYVGASGDASPDAPHLHFEVHLMAPGEGWWQGREVDPYPLLAR